MLQEIETIIQGLQPTWYADAGTTLERITEAEQALGRHFPDDYKQFVLWSNGGEGHIGSYYFSPWSVESLAEVNVGYEIDKYLPGLLGIGSDLGPLSFALTIVRSATALHLSPFHSALSTTRVFAF